MAFLWRRASNTAQSSVEDDGGNATLCPIESTLGAASVGKGVFTHQCGLCVLKALLNQTSKTLSNMVATQDSSPCSSLVSTKILHFHNIHYKHLLLCTVSSLYPINPLSVINKLRHREGLSLNCALSPHQEHKQDPELMTTG